MIFQAALNLQWKLRGQAHRGLSDEKPIFENSFHSVGQCTHLLLKEESGQLSIGKDLLRLKRPAGFLDLTPSRNAAHRCPWFCELPLSSQTLLEEHIHTDEECNRPPPEREVALFE